MQVSDIRNPGERNKLILAGVLGIVALVFLWWTFFGFGSSSSKIASHALPGSPRPRVPTRARLLSRRHKILSSSREPNWTSCGLSTRTTRRSRRREPKRNIFVYYEPTPRQRQSLPFQRRHRRLYRQCCSQVSRRQLSLQEPATLQWRSLATSLPRRCVW